MAQLICWAFNSLYWILLPSRYFSLLRGLLLSILCIGFSSARVEISREASSSFNCLYWFPTGVDDVVKVVKCFAFNSLYWIPKLHLQRSHNYEVTFNSLYWIQAIHLKEKFYMVSAFNSLYWILRVPRPRVENGLCIYFQFFVLDSQDELYLLSHGFCFLFFLSILCIGFCVCVQGVGTPPPLGFQFFVLDSLRKSLTTLLAWWAFNSLYWIQ